ncbi:MAG TPA: prephenate dehydrogenase, partial [Marmoricola sp.]|nr:prephenate dehydrogenase [Marmoricola sp.]
MPEVLKGPVEIVGAGLLGTSIALALRKAGIEVWLSDINSEHVRTASGLGAGIPRPGSQRPQLVVVAVPPSHLATSIVEALDDGAYVTDVGSVKAGPLEAVADQVEEPALARYVGGHPMAGNERSGPLAASAALFEGRPWAITQHVQADPKAVALVEELVALCGAEPVRMSPVEHDHAVARTSHLPHVLSVLTAGQLTDAEPAHLVLSGQGVRDVTRVAAGDPDLYGQILFANAPVVTEVLIEVREQLDRAIDALKKRTTESAEVLEEILMRGNDGRGSLLGKHGRAQIDAGALFVVVPDGPGELARLFRDVSEIGVNIEDLRIEH